MEDKDIKDTETSYEMNDAADALFNELPKAKSPIELQAIQDAINAIIDSRRKGSGPRIKQDQDSELDPDLLTPPAQPNDDDNNNNIKIDDPDKILKDMKNKQQKQQNGEDDDNDDDNDSDADGGDSDESSDNKDVEVKNKDKESDSKSGDQSNDDYDEDDLQNKLFGDNKNNKSNDSNKNSDKDSDKSDAQASSHDDREFDQKKKQQNELKRAKDLCDQVSGAAENKKDELGLDQSDIDEVKEQSKKIKEMLDRMQQGEDVSSEEMQQAVNDALDAISKITSVNRETEGQKNTRLKKIKSKLDDPLERKKIEDEDRRNSKEYKNAEIKARSEKNKAARSGFAEYADVQPIKNFEIDFYNSIRDQIHRCEEQTRSYTELDPQYADDDIIIKGKKKYMSLNFDKPRVCMYVDRSGSWGSEEVEKSKQAISSVIEFQQQGKIDLVVKYFSDNVVTEDPYAGFPGGTNSWKPIMRDIEQNGYNNIVLVTDADMENQAAQASETVVEGEVWFIWKYSRNARAEIVKKLRGELSWPYGSQYALY